MPSAGAIRTHAAAPHIHQPRLPADHVLVLGVAGLKTIGKCVRKELGKGREAANNGSTPPGVAGKSSTIRC